MIRHEDVSEEEEDNNKVSVENLIKDLDLENSEYIMLPVNDNKELSKDAGDHWSLLVYGKKTNKFYHYDSIEGSNEKHARKIITSLIKANKCFKDEMEKKKSTQQADGHSCGVITIMHASKLAISIVNQTNSEEVFDIDIGSKDDIVKTRNWINEIITTKDSTDDNKKGQVKELEMIFYNEITKECWFHTNGHCKFGDRCINEHKSRCMGKVLTGRCNNKNCRNGHPIVCRNIEKERTCSMYNARKCLYLHLINYYGEDG